MPVQTRIKLRKSTDSAWNAANPVLALGEPGYVTDTGFLKIGNGTTAWASLPYVNGGKVIPQSQVEGLVAHLAVLAPLVHEHSPSDITGLAVVDSDPRLSDARTPTAHTHTAAQVTTVATNVLVNTTLTAEHKNTYVTVNSASAVTITVPDVLANGESVNFIQAAAGQITFAGSGVTIYSADSMLKTAKQYAGATVVKSNNVYYLIGNLAA